MRSRYYEANNCYYMSGRQRRRILRRRIRCACNIIIGVSLFMVVGIMGGVEQNNVSLAAFFAYESIAMSILLIATWVRLSV